MNGKCIKCRKYILDCICDNYVCPPAICSYDAKVTITGPVVCKDGTKFEDYTWEQHLKYLGYRVREDEV